MSVNQRPAYSDTVLGRDDPRNGYAATNNTTCIKTNRIAAWIECM
jgi:hypothetical protein